MNKFTPALYLKESEKEKLKEMKKKVKQAKTRKEVEAYEYIIADLLKKALHRYKAGKKVTETEQELVRSS